MKSTSKLVLASMIAIGALGAAPSAMATRLSVSGIPAGLLANSTHSGWIDQFTLTGASVGTCPGDSTGVYAVLSMPGTVGAEDPSSNRMWNLVVAAELANRSVTVLLDDSLKDASGRCIAIWIAM
ncbi:MAG TPA: hypothetical protein VGH91_12115 [Gammaproteobacteria bacterium]|jgi:hypothetical protein